MRLSHPGPALTLACAVLLAACATKPAAYTGGPYVSGVSGPPIPGYPPNAIFMTGPPTTYRVVSLNREGALEALKVAKPGHYAIAQRLIKAAAQICAPGAPQPQATEYRTDDIACSASVWYESNPPKRQLMFRVDDTVYEMLVTVPL